ncbi:MAG: glycosyltransferase 87 family protein [Gemmatimonadota bacterium]
MRRRALLPGAAAVLFVVALGWVPGARGTPWPATILWAAAFGFYVLAATWHARRPISRREMWTLAILARLALLPLTPWFSDDIYRYLWDGWVQIHGVNPYLHAPADSILAPLRTGWHALINHPTVPTIYPPGAQLIFRALAAISTSVLLFKAAWILADLGVGWVLDRLTASRASTPSLAPLLYLWSPLVLLEVAWSGHVEPLGILPMLGALLIVSSGHRRRGGAALAGTLLGLGVSVKLAPAAAIPAAGRWRVAAGATAIAVPALLYLPYLSAGGSLIGGLTAYAERWEFNAGLYAPLVALLGPTGAKGLAAAAVAGIAAYAAWRRWSLGRALYWTIGGAIALSPTVHPWYVLWILPLAALRGGRAWLLLSGAVFLAYWGLDTYAATGSWPEPLPVRLLIHIPFLVLLGVDALAAKQLPGRGHVAGREECRENGRADSASSDQDRSCRAK